MPDGLLVDWGGVLTAPLGPSLRAFAAGEGLDPDAVVALLVAWMEGPSAPQTGSPLHRLERGELGQDAASLAIAAELERRGAGAAREPAQLLERFFATFDAVTDDTLVATVARIREAGVPTALLSNSWGNAYSGDAWKAAFDVLVISGEVGARKPERPVFEHAADALGVPLEGCVFVDDERPNVDAARGLGLTAVHHTDPAATVARLSELFALEEAPR